MSPARLGSLRPLRVTAPRSVFCMAPSSWRPWRIGTKHCRGGSGLMLSYCEPCAGSHRGCPR